MTDFGKDSLCLDELKLGRFATGAALVAQRYYHRLITPRGALRGGEEEANFGEGLEDLLGANLDAKELEREIRRKAERAAALEDEILLSSLVVDIEISADGAGGLTANTTIAADTAAGPFRLVFALGPETIKLLTVKSS